MFGGVLDRHQVRAFGVKPIPCLGGISQQLRRTSSRRLIEFDGSMMGRDEPISCVRRVRAEINQTPQRGQRIAGAADALGVTALDVPDVLAQPFIVMRTDHQDALSAGLAVNEYAPSGKSAEEIRRLWYWVEARLGIAATILPEDVNDLPIATMPAVQPSAESFYFA